ncbi:AbgT family transporter [Desulfonatronum thioautotrophicum]|uniref:AbgT family transporter n=1 Tax=Desulfonatronum thioautotrophicum TaxID=617001 RepID=UPI0005EB17F5|nr:AbgT family transporter [Desulfonatronum thioautotrophicum]
MAETTEASKKTIMQRFLDTVEQVGNRVPHPVIIFLILIGFVIVLSYILEMFGARVTYQVFNPQTYELETVTTHARSLASASGIRDMYVGVVPNLMGFTAIGLLVVAMVGVGVAEEAGLIRALIRMLVAIAPSWSITYLLAFVGVLSSIAADAGYVVLIPLAGAAYLSLGRHPLAGIALGFAAVAGAFNLNMFIKPLDAVLVELTNNAIHLVDPTRSIELTSGLWFSIVSVPLLVIVIALITDRVISPRLGKYEPCQEVSAEFTAQGSGLSRAEWRGLGFAALALVLVLGIFAFLTLPSGAPLRNPETAALIGNSPFMNGLIVAIMFVFLATGVGYGIGAGSIKSSCDVIAAMTKAVSGLGGTILLFLVISQFIAYFNYSNMPTLMAVTMADTLKAANIGSVWMLLGFIFVVILLNFVFTPAIAKWAIFAPVFVPLFVALNVDPEAVLAAYRVGDSTTNSLTPLNAYFALVVGYAQKYAKDTGIGTVVALLIPYALWMTVAWTVLFLGWYLVGLPWGF